MAAQVFSGIGGQVSTTKFSYTNNTGQNVRVRIMNIEGGASSALISGPGVSGTASFSSVGALRDYVLGPGQTFTISGASTGGVSYNILVIPEGG